MPLTQAALLRQVGSCNLDTYLVWGWDCIADSFKMPNSRLLALHIPCCRFPSRHPSGSTQDEVPWCQ